MYLRDFSTGAAIPSAHLVSVNAIRTKRPPDGEFTEVSSRDEEGFLKLAKKRQAITYSLPKMGDIPHDVYSELVCQSYVEYLVDGSNQRYLVAG